MTDQIFDEVAWRAICEQCADNALKGTGLSETLYMRKLHGEIHGHLDRIAAQHHARALEIARQFGYVDSAELEVDAQWNAEHGYCWHGIPFNHCPMGCGSAESDDEDG